MVRLAVLLACLCAAPGAALEHPWRIGPEEIRAGDPRALAEALVARLHSRVDLTGPPASGRPPIDDAEIIMMAPRQALESMRKNGLLNAHQTRTSGGFHRGPERFLAEQELAMARLPYGAKGRALLPKYALLVRGERRAWRLPTRYGDAVIVFKKTVRARATWTYADSLDFDAQDGLLSLGAGNPTLARTFRYRPVAGDANACRNYCEVQVWGPLDWADVDRVEPSSAPPSPADPAAAARNYADGLKRARLSNAELITVVESSTASWSRDSFSDGALAAWELAVRPKLAPVVAALSRALDSQDAQVRAAALYGLGEVPWKELKPILLRGLADPAWPVLGEALALAAEHNDDPDVRAGLDDLQRRVESPHGHGADEARVLEWLARAAGR